MPPEHQITRAIARELSEKVSGDVLLPDDAGFEEARPIWNGRLNRRPGAIVQCADANDVVAGVNMARERDLLMAVRSGGHDYAGRSTCEGGLVLDLSRMNGVEVEPSTKRVRVGAGATWGDVDGATQAFGLVTPGGTVSSVGVAGYTLGGGTGHLSRKFGLSADNLVSADVVTASGALVRASADENEDLFWGLRGGSGNFGIATAFEYRLHELGPDIYTGQVIYPIERAPELLRFYRDFMSTAPDEVSCYAFFIRIPPVAPFPEAYHNATALDFVVTYAGDPADGESMLEPLRTLGDPILDAVGTQSFVSLQTMFDAGVPKGNRWYSRAHHFDGLTDEAIDTLVEWADGFPGPSTMVYLEPQGGAVNRVAPDATAFPQRQSAFQLHIFPGWADPADDESLMGWARAFHEAMAPFANGGVYVNLLGEDEPARVRAAYGRNYDRLVALKKKWDPDNLFRRNHNIEPVV